MEASPFDADVIVAGGGLAGLTSAIHLTKMGIRVCVIEKNTYPKHKVCGEYISNEVLPYLKWLGVDIEDLQSTEITSLHFSSESGKSIKTQLPLGGFGVSRYSLDFALCKKALSQNCKIIEESVAGVLFNGDFFDVQLGSGNILSTKVVLGAFGKRSTLDQRMNRSFFREKSPWLAVKAHYTGSFPEDLVGLHNFRGGYCGVSKVENHAINICYLTNFKEFKKHKNIDEFQEKVLSKNPHLKNILQNSSPLFDKPLTISQISFSKKNNVEDHILMIGDTAGLIHPLCGNGMAMAIRSAKIASEQVLEFFDRKISRTEMENNYHHLWNREFKQRMWFGRILGNILRHPKLSEVLTTIIAHMPFLLPVIIRKTHGKEIAVQE